MSGFLRTSVQVRHALPFGELLTMQLAVREKRADERIVVLRISPDITMAIGATVMDSDDKSIGEQLELMASHRPGPTEMDAYERLLGDAMEGNKAFFAREDYVEEAWRIVDPVIKAGTPLYEYELGAQRSERACLAAGWLAQPDSFHAAMKIEVLEDGDAVAQRAAGMIAEAARAAAAACGRFVVAVSGGRTPWVMLRALAGEDVPWPAVHVVQVDERVAPAGDPDRNLTHLRESLLAHAPLRPEQIHAMPVEEADLAEAAERDAATLRELAGAPPALDLVHLGLGPDGHTASLVPGDPVLDVRDADVALAGPYQGRRRMTLTSRDRAERGTSFGWSLEPKRRPCCHGSSPATAASLRA